METKTFFEDLSALHTEVQNPVKTTKGYADRYQYAELQDILSDDKPILAKHNFTMFSQVREGKVIMTLLHASGKQIESELELPDFGGDAQKLGSFLTYARRYQILMLLNIAQQDEDGEATKGTTGATQEASYAALLSTLEAMAPKMRLDELAEQITAAKNRFKRYPRLLKRLNDLEAKHIGSLE